MCLRAGGGISSIQTSGLLDRITDAWADAAKPLAREGAMLAFTALVKQLGESAEPYLLPLIPLLLERYADKVSLLAPQCCAKTLQPKPTGIKQDL